MVILFVSGTDLVMSSVRDGLADGNPSVIKCLLTLTNGQRRYKKRNKCFPTQCYLYYFVLSMCCNENIVVESYLHFVMYCCSIDDYFLENFFLNRDFSSFVWRRLVWWMLPTLWIIVLPSSSEPPQILNIRTKKVHSSGTYVNIFQTVWRHIAEYNNLHCHHVWVRYGSPSKWEVVGDRWTDIHQITSSFLFIKPVVLWDVLPCSPVEIYQRFGDACSLRDIGNLLPDYTASHRKRRKF
jgi:hypothetical protein